MGCSLQNNGTLTALAPDVQETIIASGELINNGVWQLFSSEATQNRAIIDNTIDFVNNGVLRAFNATFNNVVLTSTSVFVPQFSGPNTANGLDVATLTANGVISPERGNCLNTLRFFPFNFFIFAFSSKPFRSQQLLVFPFWPSVGDTYTLIIIRNGLANSDVFSDLLNLEGDLSYTTDIVLDVTAVPFIANDDMAQVDEDSIVVLRPLDNDYVEGGLLMLVENTLDSSLFEYDQASGQLTYRPSPNLDENQQFTYTVQNGIGEMRNATISIIINPINDPPNQLDPDATLDISDNNSEISLPGEDIDTPVGTLHFVIETLPAAGSISQNGTEITQDDLPFTTTNPTFTYLLPDAGSGSVEVISYSLNDGEFQIDSSPVALAYSPPNDLNLIAIIVPVALGACCLLVFCLAVVVFITSRPKKPRAKTALVHLLARSDLALVLSLIDLNPTEDLALHLANFFLYHQAISTLLAYLIGETVNNEESPELLFRENKFVSKLLKINIQLCGAAVFKRLSPWVEETIKDKNTELEVDPVKLSDSSTLAQNQENLKKSCTKLFGLIKKSVDDFPTEIRQICSRLHSAVEERWNRGQQAVGAAIFLRWICPALVTPERKLTSHKVSGAARRRLLLVSKVLQTLANVRSFLQFWNHPSLQYS